MGFQDRRAKGGTRSGQPDPRTPRHTAAASPGPGARVGYNEMQWFQQDGIPFVRGGLHTRPWADVAARAGSEPLSLGLRLCPGARASAGGHQLLPPPALSSLVGSGGDQGAVDVVPSHVRPRERAGPFLAARPCSLACLASWRKPERSAQGRFPARPGLRSDTQLVPPSEMSCYTHVVTLRGRTVAGPTAAGATALHGKPARGVGGPGQGPDLSQGFEQVILGPLDLATPPPRSAGSTGRSDGWSASGEPRAGGAEYEPS